MPRKYHMHNASQFPEPSIGVPLHSLRRQGSEKATDGEIIFPTEIDASSRKKKISLFDGDSLFGQLKSDDIMLLCIILLVLQNDDELDMGLLLALGYIFLSDKTFDGL